MSAFVELRKEQLKTELASLETAEQRAKTLASQLADADAAVNAASQLVALNKARLAEGIAELEGLSKQAAFIPQGMSGTRANHDLRTQRVDRTVGELTAERDQLKSELNKKQYALGKILEQIQVHPAYKSARAEQRKLIAEATKLAATLFQAPLNDLSSILSKISLLADAEQKLLSNEISTLRASGLPDVRPALARFLQQVTPHAVLDALPDARSQVFAAITQINELASREVVR